MATNFPGSVDDASTVGDDSHPSADELLSSTDGGPAHHALHQNVGLAINAIEDKVGTGASTPVVGSVLTGTGSGTSGWSTDPLYVDETNSRVGIGTTSPAQALEVDGQVVIGAGDDITPDGTGNGHLKIDGNGYASFVTTDGTGTWIGNNSNGRAMILATDETARLTVSGTGNVGIGTTTPAEELHILKDQDGDLTQMLVENLDQRVRIGSYYEAGVAQFAKIQSEADNGSDQALVLNPEGGNVGIGTNSPGYLLDVDGDINTTGDLRINGAQVGAMQTFTPTFNNVTLGASGTVGGRYAQIGNLVFYKAAFFLNGTGSVTGHINMNLPVGTGDTSSTYHVASQAWVRPAGLTIYHAMTYQAASQVFFYVYDTSSTRASIQDVDASDPATWTSSGSGYVSGWYLTT